jgi:hypothetical protein
VADYTGNHRQSLCARFPENEQETPLQGLFQLPELQRRALPRVPGGEAAPRKAGNLQNIGGGIAMNKSDCLYERISNMGVSIALFIIALGLCVITIVALPVVGFVIAAPVFLLSIWFLTAPRSRECRLS